NVEVWNEQIIPANGIYACRATLGNERFMAATSVGIRPQFNGKDVRVEAYLLDFVRDIYGQQLPIDFIAWLRGAQKFDSLDALIQQIQGDVNRSRELLAQRQAI